MQSILVFESKIDSPMGVCPKKDPPKKTMFTAVLQSSGPNKTTEADNEAAKIKRRGSK